MLLLPFHCLGSHKTSSSSFSWLWTQFQSRPWRGSMFGLLRNKIEKNTYLGCRLWKTCCYDEGLWSFIMVRKHCKQKVRNFCSYLCHSMAKNWITNNDAKPMTNIKPIGSMKILPFGSIVPLAYSLGIWMLTAPPISCKKKVATSQRALQMKKTNVACRWR